MRLLVKAIRVVLVFSAAAATASCSFYDITSLCGPVLATTDYQDPQIAKFMDGLWVLKAVNEKPIPSTGFPLPKSGDRLRSGTLEFNTHQTDGCSIPTKSSGDALATYLLADNTGHPKLPNRVQAGSFTFNHDTHDVTLDALGHSIVGRRSGATLFVLANIGDDGPYGLLFQR